VKKVGIVAKQCVKGCVGEWGYRQLHNLKQRICDRRVARVRRMATPTLFPPAFVEALGVLPKQPSAIVDHLGTLFFHTISVQAQFVVELGTRGGESTRAFLAAVSMTGGRVLSIDINDCGGIELPEKMQRRWQFVKADDIAFGRHEFAQWCNNEGQSPAIDVLFIDTSHLYEHTVQEIETWQGFVRPGGLMIFHDTNMGEGVFRRRDNSICNLGWNNHRGVIKAIEEFLGVQYNANAAFVDISRDWIVSHEPCCSGMTILLRLPANAAG
jgi:predicted O-methyltransferase YrrM